MPAFSASYLRRIPFAPILSLFLFFQGVTFAQMGAPIIPSATLSANQPGTPVPPTLFSYPLLEEGREWNSSDALLLTDEVSELLLELPEVKDLRHLVLQADGNDTYAVDASIDGSTWKTVWRASSQPDLPGLRTRWVTLATPETARHLRVRASNGDGSFSISKFFIHDALPSPWPPELLIPHRKENPFKVPFLTEGRVDILKECLAGAGLLLLLAYAITRKVALPHFGKRFRDSLLAFCGALSLLAWFNFGQFHFHKFIHSWDFYHYYIGAKYAPELGYSRIYDCSAIVDLESGREKHVRERKLRNLSTNLIESTRRALADPAACTSHFSPERWAAFSRDIIWFRTQLPGSRWEASQKDHGFNGTPVWTILGGVLSNTTSANNRTVFILGLIDPLLVLIMFGALWKTFGWRSMCFALIFFGTNEPARYFWTGGSFLRYDWLLSLALGICALHRERWKSAGFLLTLAGLLRIFPVLALGGVGLAWLARSIHTRSLRPTTAERRIALGALVAIALLLPLSLVVTGDQNVWREFASNARKHLETPLTNHMGLRTALSYRDDLRSAVTFDNRLSDPFEAWKEGRRSTFHERRLLFFAVVSMIVLLIMWRSASCAPWETAILGTGLIPFMTELTCYYYSFFLLFALLWEKRSMPVIALLTFGWGSWKIAQFYPRYDECFTVMSIAALLVPLVAVWTAHPRASQIDTGHRETSRIE